MADQASDRFSVIFIYFVDQGILSVHIHMIQFQLFHIRRCYCTTNITIVTVRGGDTHIVSVNAYIL